MTDPLDALADPTQKVQLWKLRSLAGSVQEYTQLRTEDLGFGDQRGIHRPKGSRYALWVRQTRQGPYPDEDPVVHSDGSWTYRYAPEGRGGISQLDLPTNQGLLNCEADGVPVGVLREKPGYGRVRSYEVLGLAFVKWDGSHFVFQGEPMDWEAPPVVGAVPPPFEPREPLVVSEVTRAIRNRRFAWAVRQVYHEKCSLCELGFRLGGRTVGIEAAHLIPFEDGGNSHDVRNGVALCRNHHALFDEFAWAFDEDLRVHVAADKQFRVSATLNHILGMEGERLRNLPDRAEDQPAQEAIRDRLERFEKAWE